MYAVTESKGHNGQRRHPHREPQRFLASGRPFGTDRPGKPLPEIARRLSERYEALAPEVLCLQEIQSQAACTAVAGCLGMDAYYCPGVELTQYGGAIAMRGGHPALDARASSIRPQRVWQVIDLDGSGANPLRICNVHLPSSRQLGAEAAVVRRVEEISDMLILATACGGAPHVIVGDFNERPGGAIAESMQENRYVDVARLTGREDLPTSLGGSRGDQAWAHETVVARIAGYGVLRADDIIAEGVSGKRHLSDHMPLWIDLEA